MRLFVLAVFLALAACTRAMPALTQTPVLPPNLRPAATQTSAPDASAAPTDTAQAAVLTQTAPTDNAPTAAATQTAPAEIRATEPPPPTPPATATSLHEGLDERLAAPPTPGSWTQCPEPYPWYFDNPADECAAVITHVWASMQPFERGLMLWLQEGGLTFVLVDDGSPFKPYRPVSNPDGVGAPAPDNSIQPPPGLYQPELGFAVFWRGLVPGSEWVRGALGWALAPEQAYPALWQCNTAAGDDARCYISGPGDEIIVLARGSAQYWNYYQTAVREP